MSTKLKLNNVTLICVDTLNVGSAVLSLRKSMEQCEFKEVKLLTNVAIELPEINVIQIPIINSKKEYSKFIIKELYKYFDTEYVLLTQHDSWVLDSKAWDDSFYCDYIGSLWNYYDNRDVGNGGFSLRSYKLQKILGTDENIKQYTPEDEVIGRLYRQYLEDEHNIKFADESIAEKFSFELREPICNTFGFHSFFHSPFKPVVVIQRQGALGDVISIEPVLEYFYKKGYRVVLNTMPEFKELFRQHRYKIEFFDEFDYTRIPYKFINLDMSYESKPKQLHLKSYYEYAGITDGEIKTPELNLYLNYREEIKLFKKYAIIHVDERPQEYRNIKGINWYRIVQFLKQKGYDVIQVGKSEKEINGAIKINTPNLQFLMWVVASSDLFIGIDSGISHIACAFNVPSIIFFGSVSPFFIHPNDENKIFIYNKHSCQTPFCWHDEITTTGKKCYIDNNNPPCANYNDIQLIDSINKITNGK